MKAKIFKANILSWGYRKLREHYINKTYRKQGNEGRPKDLEEVVKLGDSRLLRLHPLFYQFPIPSGISRKLYDLEFPSPLTLSSFKDELEIIGRWMQLGLGGACIKTVMKDPREGNNRPRLQEVMVNGHSCLINAMGLPGKGVEARIQDLRNTIQHPPGIFSEGKPIGISIGGSSIEEYRYNFKQLNEFLKNKWGYPYYFEINGSCPNTPDGQQLGKTPVLLYELLDFARCSTQSVIGFKASPDLPDDHLLGIASAISHLPRMYINLGNTQSKTCADVGLSSDAISIGKGGLSGPALYERTLAMTHLVSRAHIGIPIIATGGVDSAEKVKELLDAGATLVGMATAVVQDMYCIPKINYKLKNLGI